MDNVYMVYLVSRQVLLARVSDANDPMIQVGPSPKPVPSRVLVDKPFELVMAPDQRNPGRMVPSLMPYGTNGGLLPPIESQVFDRQHIMHINPLPVELMDAYSRAATGIVLAR